MMAIFAIAYNTFLESIRKLELVLFLLLGAILVGIICFLTTDENAMNVIIKFMSTQEMVDLQAPMALFQDEEAYVASKAFDYMKSSAMFFNELLTMIIALLITIFMIPREISSGAVLYILPKPVQRYQYILGKYFGALAIVTACFWLMGLEMLIFFAITEGAIDPRIIEALLVLPLKFGIFIGFIILLSIRLPSVIAGIIALLLYIGGHVSERISDMFEEFSGLFLIMLKIGHFILPNLSPVFSGTIMDPEHNLFETYMSIYVWSGKAIFYNAVLLVLAILFFRRKSL